MSAVVQPVGTVTLVFTDIEGSTRLLAELGEVRYLDALSEHRQAVREAFARYGGYEVDTEGDSFFYAFQSAAGAVRAVGEAMAALEGGPIAIRVGVHTGEPGLDGHNYVGLDVHTAARVMAAGHGGQVVVSQSTRDLLDESFVLLDLGEHRLKDLSGPRRLYQLGDRVFPPLRTLHRTNLPVPSSWFVGRERELAELGELVQDGVRLLTLTGPGGSGKTRLALQAVAGAADAYPDGVWWVPLASLRDPDLVLSSVALALGVPEQAGRGLEETLVDVLLGGRALLLLDNLEQLLPGAADSVAKLRDAGARVVTTSRERLRLSGELVYPVAPLAETDAAELFFARTAALGVDGGDGEAVSELCSRLDHLPHPHASRPATQENGHSPVTAPFTCAPSAPSSPPTSALRNVRASVPTAAPAVPAPKAPSILLPPLRPAQLGSDGRRTTATKPGSSTNPTTPPTPIRHTTLLADMSSRFSAQAVGGLADASSSRPSSRSATAVGADTSAPDAPARWREPIAIRVRRGLEAQRGPARGSDRGAGQLGERRDRVRSSRTP
jgi:class 3 adenylate cyclase